MSELENILDDALEDFDKEVARETATTNSDNTTAATDNAHISLPAALHGHQVQVPAEPHFPDFSDFIQDTSGLEENIARTMENLFGGAANNNNNTTSTLTNNPSNTSNNPSSNNLTQPPDSMEGMVPMLEGLLSKLLSKEILHEPLQELHELYPAWLDNNKDNVKLHVYQQQHDIIKNICHIFNGDNYEKERNKIYELLNDMQDTGPPPEDIVNKMSQDIPDAMRAPPLPSPDQCCVQ